MHAVILNRLFLKNVHVSRTLFYSEVCQASGSIVRVVQQKSHCYNFNKIVIQCNRNNLHFDLQWFLQKRLIVLPSALFIYLT